MKSPGEREKCRGLSPTTLQHLEVGRSQKGGRKTRREWCHRRPRKEVLRQKGGVTSNRGVSWSGYPRLCSGNKWALIHSPVWIRRAEVWPPPVGQKGGLCSTITKDPGWHPPPEWEERESVENCTESLQCFKQGLPQTHVHYPTCRGPGDWVLACDIVGDCSTICWRSAEIRTENWALVLAMCRSITMLKEQFKWRGQNETPLDWIEEKMGGKEIETVKTRWSWWGIFYERDKRPRKVTWRLMGRRKILIR